MIVGTQKNPKEPSHRDGSFTMILLSPQNIIYVMIDGYENNHNFHNRTVSLSGLICMGESSKFLKS